MKWGYANCPTHAVSIPSEPFPVGQTKCMSVTDIWPDARPGQTLRGSVEAIAGMHEIIDPAVRYKPNSNRAIFQCSGVTLSYKCELASVEPLDPAETLQASELCVLNQAAFVAEFEATDLRTGSVVGRSEGFPVTQQRCLTLSETDGVAEGDKLQMTIHAALGKDLELDRLVEFKGDAPRYTVVCKGTTLDYHCSPEAFLMV